MHLANLIERWQRELRPQGIDKLEAARRAVADLSNVEVYTLLAIIAPLDHQVDMTTSGHRNLPDHARTAVMYWLERTDVRQLTSLRDLDRAATLAAINYPLPGTPVDRNQLQRFLSEQDLLLYDDLSSSDDPRDATTRRHLEEIARQRHQLAVHLGSWMS